MSKIYKVVVFIVNYTRIELERTKRETKKKVERDRGTEREIERKTIEQLYLSSGVL